MNTVNSIAKHQLFRHIDKNHDVLRPQLCHISLAHSLALQSIPMLRSVAVVCACVAVCMVQGFLIPGVAPTEFHDKDPVEIKVWLGVSLSGVAY